MAVSKYPSHRLLTTIPVLRVFTSSLESCFDLPWQSQRPQSGTGSGVYMGEQLILTGAHVVNDATFIQVQKLSSARRVVAELKSICHDADLALLKVDDPRFFEDLEIAKLGELPELKDQETMLTCSTYREAEKRS